MVNMNETTEQTDTIFDSPEFYAQGTMVATIYGPYGVRHITSVGKRAMTNRKGEVISTPSEFRKAFPDGNIVDVDEGGDWEWDYNGWFEISSLAAEYEGAPRAIFISLNHAVQHCLMAVYPK